MDARTRAWLDQEDALIADRIREYGCFIRYVSDGACSKPGCHTTPSDEPPFAYTVGLFGLAHPELLIFGVAPRTASLVLNDLARRVRAGESLLPGTTTTVAGWDRSIVLESLPNPAQIVFDANRYYRQPDENPVPVLQVSYADERGRFPWEEGHLHPERQPRPGTFSA